MADKCYVCGGPVKADGMHLGGEVDGETPDVDNAAEPSTQALVAEDAQRKARRAFIRAVRSGR